MDRPDRPSGIPLGQATQSTGRGLPENPAPQGRRNAAGGGGSLSNIPVPPIPPSSMPPPGIRNMASNSSLSTSAPITASQVIALAREAMREALEEHESQAAEASGVSNDLKPGITIDLSRKNILKLPDEVVDVIKHELERLALSHNKIAAFPSRFSECSSLRYLNVRNNDIREFPLPLCDLRSLEILDLQRNKLRSLPPEIVKLASLKVFAVQRNRIEELPLCLAEMTSLQVIKLDGNPIRFPPPEALQVQASSPPNEGYLKDSEVTEVTMTAHIKKFLKQKSQSMQSSNGRADSETGGDESSEGTETPRLPLKRVVSGRFPVKVNGTDLPDLRSPALSRPPPIPTRSHYRGLSQQNSAPRKPGVMPLTTPGNPNERVRSNSETLLQASRAERPGDRSRRMGIVSQKAQQLGTLDETQANNRFSHYRGLSHGSAMQSNGTAMTATAKDPASPAEPILQRPVYVRRLSILPERRRESKFVDPVLEAAKGILYSIFQIHPMIQMLMSLTSDGTAKRSSLEIVFYNTNSHVEELEQEIQRHDPTADGYDSAMHDNENVQRACITLVNAYAHVCSLFASQVDLFIDNGDPRYVRTLMVQLYNSIMELRVATSQVVPGDEGHSRTSSTHSTHSTHSTVSTASTASAVSAASAASMVALNADTIRARSRENSAAPSMGRPGATPPRTARSNYLHNPSNLRVATDVPIPSIPFINGTGRTATITSATPRSGESFVSSGSRGLSADFSEEDRIFESIFLALQRSTDLVMKTLPGFNNQCGSGLQNALAQRNSRDSQCWRALMAKCTMAIQQTEQLKSRLSLIRLKEHGIRTQASFWNLCRNFIDSWTEFGSKVKEFMPLMPLPADTRVRLRPIQKSIQETTDLIIRSPWGYSLRSSSGMNGGGGHAHANSNSNSNGANSPFSPGVASDHGSSGSSGNHVVQLPMTPQSAALGPAVQATVAVPATPQSASFAAAFSGGVFERAGALLSMGGPSMSRHGTFTSSSSTGGSSSGLNSISSTLSSNADTMMSSILSPGPSGPFGPLPMRMHNGSKVAL